MSLNYFSPFLVLTSRVWPFAVSLSLLSVALLLVIWFSLKVSTIQLLSAVFILAILAFVWWRDVVRESLLGFHTNKLELSFRVGMLLFISSEILFFVSFFWAFFDSRLSASCEVGIVWPPLSITPISAYSVPLLNTVILLSSGVTVTWAHHSLVNNNYSNGLVRLFITVVLGLYFLYTQFEEYLETSFSMADSVYGRTFFISTGFHGIHVIVGTLMLLYRLVHISRSVFTFNHHFMFEASAWYWHFVDVVWLFLFVSIYWWGGL